MSLQAGVRAGAALPADRDALFAVRRGAAVRVSCRAAVLGEHFRFGLAVEQLEELLALDRLVAQRDLRRRGKVSVPADRGCT
jgi:hypothetical protein